MLYFLPSWLYASPTFWLFVLCFVSFLLIKHAVAVHRKATNLGVGKSEGLASPDQKPTNGGKSSTGKQVLLHVAHVQLPPRDPDGAAAFLLLQYWTPLMVFASKALYPSAIFRFEFFTLTFETDLVWPFFLFVISVWVVWRTDIPYRLEVCAALLLLLTVTCVCLEVLSTLRPEIFSFFDGTIALRRALSESEVMCSIHRHCVVGDYWAPQYREYSEAYSACKDQLTVLANSNRWYLTEEYLAEASRIFDESVRTLAELEKAKRLAEENLVHVAPRVTWKETFMNFYSSLRSFFTMETLKRHSEAQGF